MREVTKRMISNFNISNLGYDFMGYDVNRVDSLSFHHLIVPAKNFENTDSGGYVEWNGAILVRDTSHDYLHLIEKYDFNIFIDITSEMIDQNIKGRLDPYNIKLINMLLNDFEKEWEGEIGYNGKPLIKDEFRKRLTRVR